MLHARELDFDSDVENFKMEEPSYGIIFVNENNLTFHIHDFMNKGKIYEGDENYLGFPNIDLVSLFLYSHVSNKRFLQVFYALLICEYQKFFF